MSYNALSHSGQHQGHNYIGHNYNDLSRSGQHQGANRF